MNPYLKYQQQQVLGWTRIDMLLALYDGTVERLEKALSALRDHDAATAQPLLARAQLLVAELAAGIDFSHGELPRNLFRLYEYVLHCIRLGKSADIEQGLRALQILREGMVGIRPAAIQLERNGQIPPIDTVQTVTALA